MHLESRPSCILRTITLESQSLHYAQHHVQASPHLFCEPLPLFVSNNRKVVSCMISSCSPHPLYFHIHVFHFTQSIDPDELWAGWFNTL